jgi:hypothetical protein
MLKMNCTWQSAAIDKMIPRQSFVLTEPLQKNISIDWLTFSKYLLLLQIGESQQQISKYDYSRGRNALL